MGHTTQYLLKKKIEELNNDQNLTLLFIKIYHQEKEQASHRLGFQGGAVVKNSPANAGGAGNLGSIPGLGRFPEVGNGNPLQYYCLENCMDRGAWKATVHGVSKSWKQLSTHTQATDQEKILTKYESNKDCYLELVQYEANVAISI